MIDDIPTRELADFLNVSTGFISNIKAGRKRLPPEYLERVSKRFDVPLEELVKIYRRHPDDEMI